MTRVMALVLTVTTVLLFVAAVAAMSWAIAADRQASTSRTVPACEEDAVLIGSGDFVAGRWTTYLCGPSADDYVVQP